MASLSELRVIEYDVKRQGLLVTLDSLFDTRLGCLQEFDPALALHAIQNGWHQRIYDKIPGVDDVAYEELLKKLYAARDISTLEASAPTVIIDFVVDWCEKANAMMQHSPFPGYVEVFINIFPFKLSKERASRIGNKVAELIGEDARVTMLNIDPLQISSLDAKCYFSAIIDIDYCIWLDERARTTDFKICPIPDVVLYAPRVFQGKLEDTEYSKYKTLDVFAQVQAALSPMIGLEFLEVELFSSQVTPEVLDDEDPLASLKAI